MKVEFYVLPGNDPADRHRAACRLARKGWQHGLRVFLRCNDEQECQQLDALLWHFRQESFIPHDPIREVADTPVAIGCNERPFHANGLLVNLGQDISPHLEHFSRVIEIVDQHPERLLRSRENFRHYRQSGHSPARIEL